MKLKPALLPPLALWLLVIGCASQAPSTLSRTEQCQSTIEKAKLEIAAKNHYNARELLHTALSDCSGTGFLEEGQFLLAESYFADKAWIEARGEYSSFVRYYPSSPYAEIAAYRKAVAGVMMPFVLGRDQNYTDRAIEDFNSFLTEFPSSTKLDSVEVHLRTLAGRKAESAFSIAKLYYRMEEYQAAVIALKDFLAAHPQAEQVVTSREMLLQSYITLKQFAQAEQWLAHFASDSALPFPAAKAQKVQAEIDKARNRFATKQKREKQIAKERAEIEE